MNFANLDLNLLRVFDAVMGHVCVMRVGHPLVDVPLTLDAFCAAQHLMVSLSGRAHGQIDEALAARQRRRRVVLTVNQYFTAVRVVAHTDLLTVLPASFVDTNGYRAQLIERPLPVSIGRSQVDALWHLRHAADSAHRWLRGRVAEAALTARADEAA